MDPPRVKVTVKVNHKVKVNTKVKVKVKVKVQATETCVFVLLRAAAKLFLTYFPSSKPFLRESSNDSELS